MKPPAFLADPPSARPGPPPAPDRDFWIFGYGSLMWHPGFAYRERHPAVVRGYHRAFCVYSHRYRGTKEVPGLVLGLDRGGSCRGIAYGIDRAEGPSVFAYLYDREMGTGAYDPRWLATRLDDGRCVSAFAFVVDRAHQQYTGRLAIERIIELVRQGSGERGACLDYLVNTVAHLDALGIRESTLHAILSQVQAAARKDG
jgi:glutathione-specific gamma-glutamylcyclotransferase